jgi:hypothetical protein
MDEFALDIPRNWLPPQHWRTRLAEIDHLLGDPDSRLVQILSHARATTSEIEAWHRLEPVFEEYKELVPGEAGRRLVWAMLAGDPPHRFRPGPKGAIIDVFEEPVECYRASFTNGGPNRFSSRSRNDDTTRHLLGLLAGSDDQKPMTMVQAARSLGITSKKFATRTSTLRRRQGLQIRSSSDQRLVAEIRAFDEVKSAFASAASGDFEEVPISEVERRTNYSLGRIRDAAGQSRCYTKSNLYDEGPAIQVISVPRTLLVRP